VGGWSVLRLAVLGLILSGVATVMAVTFLIAQGSAAPDGLIAIASASVGALATLMTTQRFDGRDGPPGE
jgi:hypothetical protein